MVFIGAALLIAAVLAVIISADAGSLVGLTEEQTAQLVPLIIILILVAGGAFGRRIKLREIATNIILWAGIFSTAILAYVFRDEFASIASRVAGELSPGVAIVSEDGASAKFRRALSGSFLLHVDVNNVDVPMVFDTGATAVVLTHEDAKAVGFNTDNLRYNVSVQTANGLGRAAEVTLAQVSIGEIKRQRIRAFVAKEGALETSLLGMTFLETLSGYLVTSDTVEFLD